MYTSSPLRLFSFHTSFPLSLFLCHSFWSAVICPAWRYWAIAVMEYECHLGCHIFLHCHCVYDQFHWVHRAGGHCDRDDMFAPEWSLYPEHDDMLWQSINRPLKKPYEVQMPQTRPLLLNTSSRKNIFLYKTTEKLSPSDKLVLTGCFDFMENLNKSFRLVI